jgi:hypothetical protein
MSLTYTDDTAPMAAASADQGARRMVPLARSSRGAMKRSDEMENRILFVAAFLICLPVTALAHLMPRAWRHKLLGSAAGGSFIAEARTMASMTVAFAFMG